MRLAGKKEEKSDDKRGKQDPILLSHKERINTLYKAHRLEGKVKNMGIKNIGRQKRKLSESD